MSETMMVLTAPEYLWLCISDDTRDYDETFPADLSEVTWAKDHCPVACGVGYMRADLHRTQMQAALAAKDAEIERCRTDWNKRVLEQKQEIAALRDVVRVLGAGYKWADICRWPDLATPDAIANLAKAVVSINANPLARAAVEGRG